MIIANTNYENMFNSVARQFVGRVELLEGSTLLNIFEYDGALQSFTIDRTGDTTKFFGYGISQMATVKLRDKERSIDIKKGQRLQVAYGIENDYVYTCPIFIIDEVTRDENTNELTIKAYDPIYQASGHKVEELKLQLPAVYTLKTFAYACGSILGMPVKFIDIPADLLNLAYTVENANFSGDESIREAIDDLAEMFGAIYYFSNDWELTFKRLDVSGEPVLAIDKSKYFELTAKTAHTLTNIMSVTELGDNVTTTSEIEGDTQYLRENAFLTLRDDIGELLEDILSAVQGLTIYQFECKHRGDFRLEIGDKVSFTTKDNKTIETYILNDSTTYNGGLVSTATLKYEGSDKNEGNPTTLGEALKQTYARVDKVNQEIELLAKRVEDSDVGKLTEEMASIKLTTDAITAQVSRVETETNEAIETLSKEVSQTMTEEDVTILISEEMSNNVTSVKTTTGFLFDETGLTISRSNREVTNQITEDGMSIRRRSDSQELLTTNSQGVIARNVTATTYLNIAGSRFERFEANYSDVERIGPSLGLRSGCFWLGGEV